MTRTRPALLLALLLLGCSPAGECAPADRGCSAPPDQVVAPGACPEGTEPRVCADGTGAECERLDWFGTDATCSGVVVACCPLPVGE